MTGAYRAGDELIVSNRTINGSPGFWVLTPFVMADGRVVAAVRGFLPRADFDARGVPPMAEPSGGGVPAAGGPVEVEGVLQASPGGGRIGEERWTNGSAPAVSQVDTDLLQARWGAEVVPLWLRVESGAGAPSAEGPLFPVPPPGLSKGPHLSYAAQWFIFATIALVGYPLILRRRARTGSVGGDAAEEPGELARHDGASRATMV